MISDHITTLVKPIVEDCGFELWGIEHLRHSKHAILRIYIDHESGIDVDDCATVSHEVSGVLEIEDPIADAYNLEISSPGLDRLIFYPHQYNQYVGEIFKFKLRSKIENRRNFSGQLLESNEASIVVTHDGDTITLPISDIERARLVPNT